MWVKWGLAAYRREIARDRTGFTSIDLEAVGSGGFTASALNSDIGSPPDSVCAAYAGRPACMQNLEGVLWSVFELWKSPCLEGAEYLKVFRSSLWLSKPVRMAWKSAP